MRKKDIDTLNRMIEEQRARTPMSHEMILELLRKQRDFAERTQGDLSQQEIDDFVETVSQIGRNK